MLLWGLFDNELYAEFNGERFGPFYPVSGPIPLHRYRAFRRGKADERSERIRSLADQLGVAACNRKRPCSQSAHFSAQISCD